MTFLDPLLLIAAGILAASGLIIAKKPSAATLIAKLTPYQAAFGVVLFVLNLYWWFRIGLIEVLRGPMQGLPGITGFAMIVCGLILGFFFGMPQVAKWIPGESNAEVKALELSKKIAPFQTIIGVIAISSGFLGLLYYFRILS